MTTRGVYYNEHNAYAAQWLRNLIGAGLIADGEVDERSIEDVCPDDLRGFVQCHFFAGIGGWSYAMRRSGWPDDKPIWTGSCPCQPFSPAGPRGGFADERHLWPAFFHLILERQPDIVMGEQVSKGGGIAWFDLVRSDMEGAGYAFGAFASNSCSVGAPHIRQRLYWGAVRAADTISARLEGCDARAVGREREAIERSGSLGGMADRASIRWVGRGASQARFEPGSVERSHGFCDVGRLALANGGHASTERQQRGGQQRGGQQRQQPEDGGACGVADADCQRCDGVYPLLRQDPAGWDQGDLPEVARRGSARGPGPTNGFWSNPDWLFCRDDKWRPVEPGSFPLVDGLSFRVDSGSPVAGKSRQEILRGIGNAINAEHAAEVIRAFMEVQP